MSFWSWNIYPNWSFITKYSYQSFFFLKLKIVSINHACCLDLYVMPVLNLVTLWSFHFGSPHTKILENSLIMILCGWWCVIAMETINWRTCFHAWVVNIKDMAIFHAWSCIHAHLHTNTHSHTHACLSHTHTCMHTTHTHTGWSSAKGRQDSGSEWRVIH